MYKQLIQWTAVVALIALPLGIASAGGWSGRQVLSQINHKNNRSVIVRGFNGDWRNPDVCDDASRAVLSPTTSTPEAYTEKYAALLGAQLAGREVNLFLSGCISVSGVTRPVITEIAIY